MPIDPKSLTIDSKQLLKMSVSDRVSMAKSNLGQQMLSSLTPTQYAMLFPSYYRQRMEMSAQQQGTRALSGASVGGGSLTGGPMGGGGRTSPQGGRSRTATPAPEREPAKPAWYKRFEDKFGDQEAKAGPLTADDKGKINPAAFAARIEDRIKGSKLDGNVPKWGPQFGITTGSPQEWSRFFTMVQQQESGHRIAKFNPDGSLQRFSTTKPTEKSFGPGQFNIGEYGLKTWEDVNNPDKVIDAYINVAKKGKILQYFGSVQRPNETNQHSKWYEEHVKPKIEEHREIIRQEKLAKQQELAKQDPTAVIPADPSQTGSMGLTPTTPDKPKPALAVPPLPEGMGQAFMEHYNSLPTDAHREKFRKALHRSIESKEFSVESINKEAETYRAQQQASKNETANLGPGNVIEKQQQVAATRKLALKPELKNQLEYASEVAGVKFEVTSGGQQQGGPSTGSYRHNVDQDGTSGAADGRLYVVDENGKKRYLSVYNKEDLPKIHAFTKTFASVNPSAGVGTDYMGSGKDTGELFHFGGGNRPNDIPVNYAGQRYIGGAFNEGVQLQRSEETKTAYAQFLERRAKQQAEYAARQQQAPTSITQENPAQTGSQKLTGLTPSSPKPGPVSIVAGHPNKKPDAPATPNPPPASVPAAPTATPTATPTPAAPAPPVAPTPAPAPQTPTQADNAKAPSIGETETGKPVPKMKAGGDVQAQREDLAVVNTATGEPQLMFNSTENFEVNKGRLKVTPEHRTDPEKLVEQKQPDKAEQKAETQTPIPQRTGPQPAQVGRSNWEETQSTANIFQTESFRRATAQSRFLETGNQVLGGHFSNHNSTVKA